MTWGWWWLEVCEHPKDFDLDYAAWYIADQQPLAFLTRVKPERYRRDTNTSTKVHSTLKSMKEFRLHQHLTNTVQNSYIFPENEILPQKPIFIPDAIGGVLNFWKLENAWTPQTVTDIIGCLAWLKKYEHLGVFDTGDLWTLTFCTSHIHSLLMCSSRILLVNNKVKIDTVCGVHRVQRVQIQVDNLDTSDNTEEDNSHTVMIVMMIINLVIMMTAMLSPPGCNQLSGTTLQSWEGMLHCRAGRLAAWLTVQHQQHPFVKPMLSFLPICLFFLLFCLFMLLAQRKCKSWKEFRWRPPPCDPQRSSTCFWERMSSGFPGKPHPIFWDVFRRVQEFARWDLRVKSSVSETPACIFYRMFFLAFEWPWQICWKFVLSSEFGNCTNLKWKEQMVCMPACLQKYILNCTLHCPTYET